MLLVTPFTNVPLLPPLPLSVAVVPVPSKRHQLNGERLLKSTAPLAEYIELIFALWSLSHTAISSTVASIRNAPPPLVSPIVASTDETLLIPVLYAVAVKGVPPSTYNFIPFKLVVPS